MPVSPPPPVPPVPLVDVTLALGDRDVDLSTRALTAAVVAPPRFAREGELLAAATAAGRTGADLVDVSLEPRLMGAVARGGELPVAARVATAEAGEAARAAGAALLLVQGDVAAHAATEGWPAAVVVDEVGEIEHARVTSGRFGFPLAIDTSRCTGADALVQESVAITSGCRIVRTTDVRRTRRVVEVVTALLEARRDR